MGRILVIYHSQGGAADEMARAICEAALQVDETDVTVRKDLDAAADDLLSCDAIAVGSPPYFGYMVEELEVLFRQAFSHAQGGSAGKPCAVFATGVGPASGVLGRVEHLCFSLMRLRKVADSVCASGNIAKPVLEACGELGRKLAEAAGR